MPRRELRRHKNSRLFEACLTSSHALNFETKKRKKKGPKHTKTTSKPGIQAYQLCSWKEANTRLRFWTSEMISSQRSSFDHQGNSFPFASAFLFFYVFFCFFFFNYLLGSQFAFFLVSCCCFLFFCTFMVLHLLFSWGFLLLNNVFLLFLVNNVLAFGGRFCRSFRWYTF